MSHNRNDINWRDVMAEMRNAIRKGADRVEFDVDNGVVRGVRDTHRSTPKDRKDKA